MESILIYNRYRLFASQPGTSAGLDYTGLIPGQFFSGS